VATRFNREHPDANVNGGSTAFTVLSLPARFQSGRMDAIVTESPGSVSVPESSSGLGILAFATLGAGLLRKRKHKPTQENESQV